MAANSARWGGDREDEKKKEKKEYVGEQCEVGWR